MLQEKTRYKAAGIAVFVLSAGLALLRICSFFLWDVFESTGLSEVAVDTIMDTVFTLLSQAVLCFLVPMFIYIFYQKRTPRQVFADASYKKLKWWIPLASIPIGIGCLLVTVFVSTVWLIILIIFGYNYTPSSSVYPDTFNPMLLVLSLFLTAVLPAICEEFAMRGNLLKALRGSNRSKAAILFAALAFGLFHQNITQVFYTAIFGGFAAFIVIKTGSVYPAIVIHFVNNALSVLWGYGYNYGWGFFVSLDNVASTLYGLLLFLLIGAGLIVSFTAIVLYQSKRDRAEEPVKMLYKPTLRENAWFLGALVFTAMSTIFTFAFGIY